MTGNIIRSYVDDLVNQHGRHIVFTLDHGETLHGVQVADSLSSKLTKLTYIPLSEALQTNLKQIEHIKGTGIDMSVSFFQDWHSRDYLRLSLSRITLNTLEDAGLKDVRYDYHYQPNVRIVMLDTIEDNALMKFLIGRNCLAQIRNDEPNQPTVSQADVEQSIWPQVKWEPVENK